MNQLSKGQVNIVLTGGHGATTALAVVQEFFKRNSEIKIYWVGVKNAFEGSSHPTLEAQTFSGYGVKFLPLTFGRLQRKFTFYTIPSLLKIPVGFVQSLIYILRVRPKVVLSFGGFASFGIVFWAWVSGIPVILHEQTTQAGRASLISSRFAEKILLSRAQSSKYFPKDKIVVTGNPVMKAVFKVKKKTAPSRPPVLFVTGGSRGSQAINGAIKAGLRRFLGEYRIIHQTGKPDYKEFSEIRDRLPRKLKEHYEIYTNIKPHDMPSVYEKSDVVIGRAGANTVSEIMAVMRPAVLVPLPLSYKNEQAKNAEYAKNYGLASVIPQNKLNEKTLADAVSGRLADYSKIVESGSRQQNPDAGAAGKICGIVSKYV